MEVGCLRRCSREGAVAQLPKISFACLSFPPQSLTLLFSEVLPDRAEPSGHDGQSSCKRQLPASPIKQENSFPFLHLLARKKLHLLHFCLSCSLNT